MRMLSSGLHIAENAFSISSWLPAPMAQLHPSSSGFPRRWHRCWSWYTQLSISDRPAVGPYCRAVSSSGPLKVSVSIVPPDPVEGFKLMAIEWKGKVAGLGFPASILIMPGRCSRGNKPRIPDGCHRFPARLINLLS